MGWSDVGKDIAKIGAPLLGTAIGGPFGGILSSVVSSVFGVEDNPEAVLEAIKKDPNAAVKLQQIQSDERVRLQQLSTQTALAKVQAKSNELLAINNTMQAESKSEKWPQYSWRPFVGFTYGIAFLAVTVFTCILAYKGIIEGMSESMTMIPQFIGSMSALFGVVMPILGFASYHRGKAKRIAAGETKPEKDGIVTKIKGIIGK